MNTSSPWSRALMLWLATASVFHLSALGLFAQATVQFNNTATTQLTTNSTPSPPPGHLPNQSGLTTGAGQYTIGLYIAPQGTTDPLAFTLMGPTTASQSGPSGNGRFQGNPLPNNFVISNNTGQTIAFQVRAWSTFAGSTYELAYGRFDLPTRYLGVSAIGEVSPATGLALAPALFGISAGQVGGFVLTPGPHDPGGLVGEYYDTMDLTGPWIRRTDPTVDFDWGNGSPHPGIGSDTFSVRWSGLVQPQYSETYTFYTQSDDGVRLWVNGQQLIDNWTDHPSTENSGTITLQAGIFYYLRMDFYENTAGAVARLSWSSPSQAKQIIPAVRFFPLPAGRGTGLRGEYFAAGQNARFTRLDKSVDFDWGSGPPRPFFTNDNFTVTWRGLVQPPVSGSYVFHTVTDDGVRLRIGNVTVIDRWINQPATEWSGAPMLLDAGQVYSIQMDYYEAGGNAVSQLLWTPPAIAKHVIPETQLYPFETEPPIRSGNVTIVTWDSIAGRTYRVHIDNLVDGTFTKTLPDDILATSVKASKQDATSNARRFYRVELLP